MKSMRPVPIFLACAVLLGAGCATGLNLEPEPDRTRFYLLSIEPASGALPQEGIVVGLERVWVPSYLQTQRIAVRTRDHELQYSELHRWSERIDAAISRLLVEQLPGADGIRLVQAAPWVIPDEIDRTLRVRVNRFEGTEDGSVVFDAGWEHGSAAGGRRARGHFRIEESWDGESYSDLAAAMSRAVGGLAQRLSAEITAAEHESGR